MSNDGTGARLPTRFWTWPKEERRHYFETTRTRARMVEELAELGGVPEPENPGDAYLGKPFLAAVLAVAYQAETAENHQ